jgi:hypothetical protein
MDLNLGNEPDLNSDSENVNVSARAMMSSPRGDESRGKGERMMISHRGDSRCHLR